MQESERGATSFSVVFITDAVSMNSLEVVPGRMNDGLWKMLHFDLPPRIAKRAN